MSFYDLNKLSERELIAQFILESRGSCAFLSYADCQVIESWLKAARGDTELILFLLNEEFQKAEKIRRKKTLSLKFLEKKILLKVRNSQTKLS